MSLTEVINLFLIASFFLVAYILVVNFAFRRRDVSIKLDVDVSVSITMPLTIEPTKQKPALTDFVCAACGKQLPEDAVALYPLLYGEPPAGAYCYSGRLYLACRGEHCPSYYLGRDGYLRKGKFLRSPSPGPLSKEQALQREKATTITLPDQN